MTKILNHIIFFSPPKSEYFFQQHWESEYFLGKKPLLPLQVKCISGVCSVNLLSANTTLTSQITASNTKVNSKLLLKGSI
jgi:hypothetical protein